MGILHILSTEAIFQYIVGYCPSYHDETAWNTEKPACEFDKNPHNQSENTIEEKSLNWSFMRIL